MDKVVLSVVSPDLVIEVWNHTVVMEWEGRRVEIQPADDHGSRVPVFVGSGYDGFLYDPVTVTIGALRLALDFLDCMTDKDPDRVLDGDRKEFRIVAGDASRPRGKGTE